MTRRFIAYFVYTFMGIVSVGPPAQALFAQSETSDLGRMNRFGIDLQLGFAPNQFGEFTQGERDESDTNDRLPNRLRAVNRYYTNGANYTGAPVVRDFRFNNDANYAVPVALGLRYLWKDFRFHIGYTRYAITGTYKSYYSVVGPLTRRSDDAAISAYDDIYENYDGDNRAVERVPGLFPTGGREYKFTEYTTAERTDIPLSVALHLNLAQKYSLYAGGGLGYHFGRTRRVIEARPTGSGGDTPRADIDVFEARTIGIFAFLSSEYNYSPRISLISTIMINYGESTLTRDRYITGSGTVDSLFHAADDNDRGGSEKKISGARPIGAGAPRFGTLSFTGITALVGVAYYINAFR